MTYLTQCNCKRRAESENVSVPENFSNHYFTDSPACLSRTLGEDRGQKQQRGYAFCMYVFWFMYALLEKKTCRHSKIKEEVTEFYKRTKAIVLQQHPHFPLAVISALLSHPASDWASRLHPALRLLRIKRERGRQEGHLRGIDAWDIRALLTERERERRR